MIRYNLLPDIRPTMTASRKSRLIVITGATRGLGRAMTRFFSGLGHQVVGCGRNANNVHALQNDPGPPENFSALDVTDGSAVQSWAEETISRLGPPQLLINNAALINKNAPFRETSEEEFSAVIDVNLKGVANVCRAFLPAMVDKNEGVVINLSSGAGRMGIADITTYCTTKWGIEGMTQSLALELPDGMAAIPLSPGIVNTDMLQSLFGDDAQSYPTPDEWIERVADYILSLGPKDNGLPLTVPE